MEKTRNYRYGALIATFAIIAMMTFLFTIYRDHSDKVGTYPESVIR